VSRKAVPAQLNARIAGMDALKASFAPFLRSWRRSHGPYGIPKIKRGLTPQQHFDVAEAMLVQWEEFPVKVIF
jgi:hypothetical protein